MPDASRRPTTPARAEGWKRVKVKVWLDVGTYGEVPDEDEIAYLLRMGGIDAMTEVERDACPDRLAYWAED